MSEVFDILIRCGFVAAVIGGLIALARDIGRNGV